MGLLAFKIDNGACEDVPLDASMAGMPSASTPAVGRQSELPSMGPVAND
jgi:hypothetical protein